MIMKILLVGIFWPFGKENIGSMKSTDDLKNIWSFSYIWSFSFPATLSIPLPQKVGLWVVFFFVKIAGQCNFDTTWIHSLC